MAIQSVITSGVDPTLGIFSDTSPDADYGMTNYVGCIGATSAGYYSAYSRLWQHRGMITCHELVSMEHVSLADGTANTIMFGENIGTIEVQNRQTVQTSAAMLVYGRVGIGKGGSTIWNARLT